MQYLFDAGPNVGQVLNVVVYGRVVGACDMLELLVRSLLHGRVARQKQNQIVQCRDVFTDYRAALSV